MYTYTCMYVMYIISKIWSPRSLGSGRLTCIQALGCCGLFKMITYLDEIWDLIWDWMKLSIQIIVIYIYYIYIFIYLFIYLSIYLFIYLCVYIYIDMCLYIYIYKHMNFWIYCHNWQIYCFFSKNEDRHGKFHVFFHPHLGKTGPDLWVYSWL